MANAKKTYFLTPSFDFPPPPTGPIALGNILSDPSTPDRPLNPKESLAALPPDAIITTTKTNWKSIASKENSTSIGLYAKFLELIVGAGTDANVKWARGDQNEYSFTRLDTTYFNPSDASGYLNATLKLPNIKEYLEKSFITKSLYVITGLKIATGGKARSSLSREHGSAVSLGLDGSAFAAPIDVGPELEVQSKSSEDVEWGGSDDFVFAYRVSRLKVKRKTGEVKEREYTKGALYAPREDSVGVDFELDVVEGDDFIAEEFGDDVWHVRDEHDEECFCVQSV